MARFLFTVWPFPGHIYPNIAVARALYERDHEVAFYTGTQGCTVADREGFACFPFEHIDEERLYDIMFSRSYFLDPWKHPLRVLSVLREWLIKTVPQQLADLETVVAAWSPDVIVCDPTMWGPILVLHETKQIPVAVLSYVPGCMIPGPGVALFGLGLPPPRNWYTRLLAPVVRAATDLFLANSRRAAGVFRGRHNLPPISTSVAEFTGQMPLYLVTSSPEFDYERLDLPPSVHYVGPCLLDSSHHELPAWLGQLRRDQPWVLVSEGTLHTQRPLVLQAASEGLANLPMQVIMTTGKDRDSAKLGLGPIAPNIRAERFVPYNELLPRIDLIVTTGGAGTVLAALDAGVPMVVVPTEWDKLENAQRVVEVGAGLRLAPHRCRPERLRAAVEQVLGDPSFRQNAQRIATSFARYGGATQAAELLEGSSNGRLQLANRDAVV